MGSPPQARRQRRLPTDRVRLLLVLALLGAAAVVLWLQWLAAEPHLPLALQQDGHGGVLLAASPAPSLQPAIGRPLQALVLADGRRIPASTALLHRSARWISDDAERGMQLTMNLAITDAVRQPQVVAEFVDGLRLPVTPAPRGLDGLGLQSWAVSALALALALAGTVLLLVRPGPTALLFMAMALAQALHLLLISAGALPGLGLPAWLVQADLPLRLLADLVTGAALVHVLALYPRRLPQAHAIGAVAWAATAAGGAWLLLANPPGQWWWAQGLVMACGLTAAALLQRCGGKPRHALARVLQRMVLAGAGTLALLCLAIALAHDDGALAQRLASIGQVAWTVFIASLLMLAPFLSRARQVLREFALLAGVSTVATSLTLLALAVVGLNPLAALALAALVSLGVYALARPWALNQLSGQAEPSAERMFDSLYRAARALEQSPDQAVDQLTALLREVFDPLEVARSGRVVAGVRVANDGASLVVPVPQPADRAVGAILLRHARRGRRLFNQDDVQLCERLLEQLRRAVAYDRAVEHGRTEERTRIAQDLHDDIGARLLTLMYRAPNEEIEEYIRHTLQDLKTLTRGLAASNHLLSHAAAEWKADITQRLQPAGCSLQWSFDADRDVTLTVVQWSGLTRVLRELVNNIIAHAKASHVEIRLQLALGEMRLTVADDGIGHAPDSWSHGLGLGGVRKRVKLLGGQVVWQVRAERGIRCEVRAPLPGESG